MNEHKATILMICCIIAIPILSLIFILLSERRRKLKKTKLKISEASQRTPKKGDYDKQRNALRFEATSTMKQIYPYKDQY